jgi:hypothetical protein
MISAANSKNHLNDLTSSAQLPDLATEILCSVLGAAILIVTIYACAPHPGLPQLVNLGLSFIACACQIVTASYFISKSSSDTSPSGLP